MGKHDLDSLSLTDDKDDYIIAQMKKPEYSDIFEPNVLKKLKSMKNVAAFTREMINAMEFVKSGVKKLTEQMNDTKITSTHVIQNLLKRATNQGKLNQKGSQHDVGVYKDLDLEKTEYAREFGIDKMVSTIAWLRNNTRAVFITDVNDANSTLFFMSDLLPEFMDILYGKKKIEQHQEPQENSESKATNSKSRPQLKANIKKKNLGKNREKTLVNNEKTNTNSKANASQKKKSPNPEPAISFSSLMSNLKKNKGANAEQHQEPKGNSEPKATNVESKQNKTPEKNYGKTLINKEKANETQKKKQLDQQRKTESKKVLEHLGPNPEPISFASFKTEFMSNSKKNKGANAEKKK